MLAPRHAATGWRSRANTSTNLCSSWSQFEHGKCAPFQRHFLDAAVYLTQPATLDTTFDGKPADAKWYVKTVCFSRHLYIKTNILPRQARDKHRENSKNRASSCREADASMRTLRDVVVINQEQAGDADGPTVGRERFFFASSANGAANTRT